MLSRPIADLQEQDLISLVSNGVAERRDLEFKRDLPGTSDSEIKEFLADATSLANAQGGDLVFGIEDRGGIATGLLGIDGSDVDGTLLRLENIVRDGIEPRLSVKMQWVPLASGRGALVLRFPASVAAPHRIRFKNSGRFWTRNSRGKYEMDVQELRHAFTQSDAMPQRLRQFHEEAVSASLGANMPYGMGGDPVAVVSIIPLGLLRDRRDLELSGENVLVPANAAKAGGYSWLPTLEGMLMHTPPDERGTIRAYTLTHRSGYIDAAFTIGGIRKLRDGSRVRLVWSGTFEDGVGEMVFHGASRLRSYGIEGPWVILVTVRGITEARFAVRESELSMPAWRETARLPELIIEHPDKDSLLPIFRGFWFLFGQTRPGSK